ncbi:MAG: phosphoesterase, partial [Methanoregulaceae archaeon]
LRKEFNSQIEVLITPDGKFSLRSVPPISHLLARNFNGGGHPNASGGTFPFTFTDRLLFWALKRSRHFEQFLAVAEKTDG